MNESEVIFKYMPLTGELLPSILLLINLLLMTLAEFKLSIRTDDIETILNNTLLADNAKHFSQSNIEFVTNAICERYNIENEEVKTIVVGSAKLGFSITEKMDKNGQLLKRYRPFRADSDIDLAIVSPHLFTLIWDELSRYSYEKPFLPWDSGRLGDYMVGGWLRPDYFPSKVNLRRCDDWWSVFRYLSIQHKLGRRRIRGGIYFSLEQLKYYQAKGLKDCIEYETLQNEDSIE